MADNTGPPGDSKKIARVNQGQLVLFDVAQQQEAPPAKQSLRPLLQQSSTIKMPASAYRKLFSKETTPINVSFNANNVVFQVQKVDNIQHLLSTGNDDQSSVLSPMFKVADYRAEFDSTKDNSSQPSRARAARKDKGAAAVQHHGKQRKPAIARNPVQPDSFMASARGANRVCGPQEEAGPKKRSRTDFAEEGDNGKEGQKTMFVFNNLVFEKNKTAGPGSQACRDQ